MWKKITRLVKCQGFISLFLFFIALLLNFTGILSIYAASITHGLCSKADKIIVDRNYRFNIAPYNFLKITDICMDSYEKNLELAMGRNGIDYQGTINNRSELD
jgi:hypothetical protein